MLNGIEIWAIIGTVTIFVLLVLMDTLLEKERIEEETFRKIHFLMILLISVNAVMASYLVYIF